MHSFSNLFWYRTLHVSDRFTVHHQESITVYTAIGICNTEISVFSFVFIIRIPKFVFSEKNFNLYNEFSNYDAKKKLLKLGKPNPVQRIRRTNSA